MSTILKLAERALKRLVCFFLYLVLFPFNWGRAAALEKPRNILLIRIDDRLGDVLLTTPVALALRQAFPDARLTMLVAQRMRPVVEGMSELDAIEPFDRHWLLRSPAKLLELVSRLRKSAFDLAIDCSHWHTFSLTGALLCRSCGARLRLGHRRWPSRAFYNLEAERPAADTNEVEAKMTLLRSVGVSAQQPRMKTLLGTSESSARFARDLFEHTGLKGRRVVAIGPGSRKIERRFPVACFARVADIISERLGCRVLLLWGPGEEQLVRQLASSARTSPVVAPPTDLEQLAAMLRLVDVYAGNDSGPTHLAVAVGTPTVVAFVSEDMSRWGHRLDSVKNVLAVADPDASVQAVFEDIEALLRAGE